MLRIDGVMAFKLLSTYSLLQNRKNSYYYDVAVIPPTVACSQKKEKIECLRV